MAKLYIVPTPIGNLDDITLRAVDVLREVDFILAEDTRTTSFLLRHLGIEKNSIRTTSSTNTPRSRWWPGRLPPDAMPRWFRRWDTRYLRSGVSAGQDVCRGRHRGRDAPRCHGAGSRSCAERIPVRPVLFRGVSAPEKGRAKQLQSLADEERTMVFYESPYRVVKCLEQFAEVFGSERRVSVSRELTKKFEQTVGHRRRSAGTFSYDGTQRRICDRIGRETQTEEGITG